MKDTIATMTSAKMNVVHWHLSDNMRWAVESKLYPVLTTKTGRDAGVYTQDEVHELIEYAADRGVRMVPEFDLPGHLPPEMLTLTRNGTVAVCNQTMQTDEGVPFLQLHNDPADTTLAFIKQMYTEMSALFKDEIFHIGTDETCFYAKNGADSGQVGGCTTLAPYYGPCTNVSLQSLENDMVGLVKGLKRTPMMWSEYPFVQPGTDSVVQSWRGPSMAELASRGQHVVVTGTYYVGGSGVGVALITPPQIWGW